MKGFRQGVAAGPARLSIHRHHVPGGDIGLDIVHGSDHMAAVPAQVGDPPPHLRPHLLLVAVRQHIVRPLQTLANMLEALREGDYSMRGRNVDPDDAFGEVMVEVNTLSRTLYDQRLEALEAGALLQKIIAEVDIAVFAFDAALRLRIVNKAGEALFRSTGAALHGRSAGELGLDAMCADHWAFQARESRRMPRGASPVVGASAAGS